MPLPPIVPRPNGVSPELKLELKRLTVDLVLGSAEAETSTSAAAITFVASITESGPVSVALMARAALPGPLAIAVTLRSVTTPVSRAS